MKIILMRHGETDWNRSLRIQGTQPVPLNLNGIRQVQETCGCFKECCEIDFFCVVSSPLLRAKQSAVICGHLLNVPVHILEDFRERSFGILEGKTRQEIETKFGVSNVEEIEFSAHGVEPISMLNERLIHGFFILKATYPAKSILVVTHGSVIKRIAKKNGLCSEIIPNGEFIQLEI